MEELSADMEKVTLMDGHRVTAELGKAGRTFRHLPHCRLQAMKKHRFGTLKAWTKAKSFDSGLPTRWSEVKWRPLQSYHRHHWRLLRSMTGRYMTYAVKVLQWGFAEDDTRKAAQRVFEWCSYEGPRAGEGVGAQEYMMDAYDIEDFFVNVPKELIVEAILKSVEEVKAMVPGSEFFGITKEPKQPEKKENERGRNFSPAWRAPGSRKEIQQYFSKTPRRGSV